MSADLQLWFYETLSYLITAKSSSFSYVDEFHYFKILIIKIWFMYYVDRVSWNINTNQKAFANLHEID